MSITTVLILFAPSLCAQSWGQLTTRPYDTVDAENVRVWLKLEREARCRVTVTIVGARNDTVRHLFSTLMPPGYFNVYWDKMDDSGRFVDTGSYRYVAHDCAGVQGGLLRVIYKDWERSSRLVTDHYPDSGVIGFELLKDSALVTLSIENTVGRFVDSPIADSLMHRGFHSFRWQPDARVPSGRYTIKLQVGDYLHLGRIRYRK
ncbi:MAG TPA: hypothetical protein VMY05_07640 [Acidobacteriota bacterium]|nr:hypothetical protein [Acidobacteriota bacterium]